MQKESATNTFNKGLVMDFNPIVLPQDTLCNALNATIITMNGNENVLQNDMGNGRVETAYLPEGYIPLGTAELGGIIYIVSYNPLTNKCLIGSFPSPERNITSTELEDGFEELYEADFYENKENGDIIDVNPTEHLRSPYLKLIIYDPILNPGDKYQLICEEISWYSYISATAQNSQFRSQLLPRYLKFSPIAIASNGLYVDLSDTCVWLPYGSSGYYYINTSSDTDINDYRNLVSSEYNVFTSKSSGLLGVLASLECINTFEIAWDALKLDGKWNFYFFLNWTYDNEVSPDKINLYGINVEDIKLNGDESNDENSKFIEIENYPLKYKDDKTTGNTDIMNYLEDIDNDDYSVTFFNPDYVDSLDVLTDNESIYTNNLEVLRKNDGSDNQFLLESPFEIKEEEGILTFTVYPTMPFGTLSWLGLNFRIDLAKLGSGDINLTMYRYYVNNDGITVYWGLEAYPERNKKIRGVSFTFLKINDEIIDWLKENQGDKFSYIDEYKGKSGKWITSNEEETGKDYEELELDYSCQHNDFGKSSYNGNFNFSLSFDDIEQYYTYIVKIKIDYNGDYIDYYRILYTEPVFNTFFYNNDYQDFANIELDEVLNLGFNITNESIPDSLSPSRDLKDSNGNPIDKIPSYQYNLDSDVKYYIDDVYNPGISFDVEGTVGYQSFNVNVDLKTATCEFSSNENEIESYVWPYTTLYNKSASSELSLSIKIDDDKSIINVNGNNVKLGLYTNTQIGIVVDYNRETYVSIPYEFLPITCSRGFICGKGGKEKMGIAWRDYINTSSTATDDFVHSGNDGYTETSISATNGIYSFIESALVDNDAVCIAGYLCKGNRKEPFGIVWGFGDWTKDEGNDSGYIYEHHARWYSYAPKNNDGGERTCAILFYAMKQGSSIILFTYKESIFLNEYYPGGTWWNKGKYNLVSSLAEECLKVNRMYQRYAPPTFYLYDIAPDGELLDEVAMTPFLDLYKVKDFGESKKVYGWSFVSYYPNFQEIFYIDISAKADVTLYINGNVELTDVYVKNLYYDGNNKDCTINYSFSRMMNTDSYVDAIVSDTTSLVAYDVTGDGYSIIDMNVSPSKIYLRDSNDNFEVITYLPCRLVTGLSNSGIRVRCDSGYMRIDTISADLSMNAAWMYDDMGIAIQHIYVV